MDTLFELLRQSGFANISFGNIVMYVIAGVLIFLAITKKYEPLLLIPIGFGALLANLPLADMGSYGSGIMALIYDKGIKTELLPLVTDDVDLFVCCHRQGDPSCTYTETMSCGTPIAGYDNEAFQGMVKHSGTGFLSPMDRPRALARLIADLNSDRPRLADASLAALDFASAHDFESTMSGRVEHMLSCCGGASRRAA